MNEDGNPGERGAVLFFQSTLSLGESTTVTTVRFKSIDYLLLADVNSGQKSFLTSPRARQPDVRGNQKVFFGVEIKMRSGCHYCDKPNVMMDHEPCL